MRHLILGVLMVGYAMPVMADERVPAITDPLVAKECGACHMAFPPQFLPQRSWQKIMTTLDQHFGENASLPEEQRTAILNYLLAHAGDAAAGEAGKFARSVPANATPLRITETPRWIGEHRKIEPARWADPKIKSKANCGGCHTGAARGVYEED